MQVKIVLSILLGTIGAVFVIAGCVFWRIEAVKQAYTGQGEAIVTSIEKRHNSSAHSNYYYPQLKIEVEGKQYFLTSAIGTRDQKYQVGQSVKVKYNPDNPRQFQIQGEQGWSILKSVFLLMGSALIIAAVICFSVL
ncbi:DUF3592 domain-containing protein [Clostridiaceae bacterium]|nr:DUF3592 domain-containing protein [Clostridiaceae bacterium]RKI17357.1 DUF3592 domain-containing protein [bacterium 1XD21-70]